MKGFRNISDVKRNRNRNVRIKDICSQEKKRERENKGIV